MFTEKFSGLAGTIPLLGFLYYCCDCHILNNSVYVDCVVHVAEDSVLVRVSHIKVIEKLQPESLELVCVVLKQVEVVADSRQNLIKASRQISLILLNFEFFTQTSINLVAIDINDLKVSDFFNDQVIFFCIFLQLIAYSTHNALNFLLE